MNQQGISGYTIVRNAIRGDYCIKECIQSLLPLCNEVVIGDASSDDGTTEMLREMADRNGKIRVIQQPWRQPIGEHKWFVDWINSTRKHLRYDFQMMLDADEVLDEAAYPVVREAQRRKRSLWFMRYNFWRNGRTLVPQGETCGHMVVRCGPSKLFMPSDEPYGTEEHPEPEPLIRRRAIKPEPLPVIYHYGFLRKREGMIEKSKVNIPAFFGHWDWRLSKLMLHSDKPWHDHLIHKNPYGEYSGTHPRHCHAWLKERGAL